MNTIKYVLRYENWTQAASAALLDRFQKDDDNFRRAALQRDLGKNSKYYVQRRGQVRQNHCFSLSTRFM